MNRFEDARILMPSFMPPTVDGKTYGILAPHWSTILDALEIAGKAESLQADNAALREKLERVMPVYQLCVHNRECFACQHFGEHDRHNNSCKDCRWVEEGAENFLAREIEGMNQTGAAGEE